MGMNVEIEAENIPDASKSKPGDHFKHSKNGNVYMVFTGSIGERLVNVRDGRMWSSESLFGESERNFVRWYGSYTVEVTP